MKRRKSSKEAESQKDPRSKEGKSSSSSKDTSRSHHKSFGKSAHTEEPSHTVDDSGRPPTPDPDWNKRQHVDFQPTQTWISVTARAEKPPTSFDELTDTPIDFSAFVLNRINITNLTQEHLVGPTFNLLKGTCKSLTELEYHFEEYHQGCQAIPQDYFINSDMEYLKGGSLSRQYSTFATKTKAATYEIKWIEDMVLNLWSPVKVVYDKHAYWGAHVKVGTSGCVSQPDWAYLPTLVSLQSFPCIGVAGFPNLVHTRTHGVNYFADFGVWDKAWRVRRRLLNKDTKVSAFVNIRGAEMHILLGMLKLEFERNYVLPTGNELRANGIRASISAS
ncbi:hypothetical protein Tco_0210456 [Tanacetum coccineum]